MNVFSDRGPSNLLIEVGPCVGVASVCGSGVAVRNLQHLLTLLVFELLLVLAVVHELLHGLGPLALADLVLIVEAAVFAVLVRGWHEV